MKKSKKFIILVLLISIVVQGLMGNITYSQNNSKDHTEKLFSDITNHWAKESINFLAEKDYVSGYVTDEGYVIKPDSKITRAEYLAVLLKTKKLEVIKEKTKEFTDVKDNNWFKEMVDIASSNGIPEGYPDGSFKPNNPITRAEIASLLVKLNNWTLDELNLTIDNFIDVEKNSWFYSPVMICKERGIINGYSDKFFKPHNYASRGEAFTLIANYVKSLNSTELESRTLNLKIVVSMKNGEKLSKEFSIDVLKPLPDEIFENVLNINKYITKYASGYFSNNENANIEELVEELQSILTQDERIKEVNNLNGTIEIVLSSGLRTFIQVVNYELNFRRTIMRVFPLGIWVTH